MTKLNKKAREAPLKFDATLVLTYIEDKLQVSVEVGFGIVVIRATLL